MMTVKDFLGVVLHSPDLTNIVVEEQDGTTHTVLITEAANAAEHYLDQRTLELKVNCFWVESVHKQIVIYTK